MKKIKHLLAVIATATAMAALLSSCWGWYDWDDPGPYHHRPHHHHHHRPGPRY